MIRAVCAMRIKNENVEHGLSLAIIGLIGVVLTAHSIAHVRKVNRHFYGQHKIRIYRSFTVAISRPFELTEVNWLVLIALACVVCFIHLSTLNA